MKTTAKKSNIISLSAIALSLVWCANSYAERQYTTIHNAPAYAQGALLKVHDRKHQHSHANVQQPKQKHLPSQKHQSGHKHQPKHRAKHYPKHRPHHRARHYHPGYGYHYHDDYHYYDGYHGHGHSHYYHPPHGGYFHFRLRPHGPAIRARGNIILDF